MNYFELFGIPVQLKVDKGAVKKKYFELSKQFHPDYFVGNSTAEQEKALETSAWLNKGLQTLTYDDKVIRYVLKSKGLLQDEEKYTLPPHFLMEMMELNEEMADADENNETAKANVKQQIAALQKKIYEPVKNIIENYKEGIITEEELLQVKEYYFKKKYLIRLNQQTEQKL